ncbi:hypothetical protein BCR35DRAFT_300467 [Leucosporidium creatinivorum]|uniref:F-box domain-containing protein n=1 Tax=Leucosporidium creatinivorum TaxID=106004 RepID=A0A1Y2G0T0_9BASI|nr:hypothetical protein BCR35DRAFT_300467 [Leucosporidium creatinivorum]
MSAASRAPAEVIRRICELLRPWEDELSAAVVPKGNLRSAALVCRKWRPEAQAMLWKNICLMRKDKAETFIKASTPIRFQTRALSLYGSDSDKQCINPTLANKVLNATRGVRSLHLSGMKGANGGLLLHPNLGDLIKLEFSNTISMNEAKLAATPDPTYRLRQLTTASWTFKPEIKIFTPIFRASATSLTSLDVAVTDKTMSTWTACLPLVASSLRTLKVTPLFSSFTQPFLNALHSLTVLETYTFDLFMDQTYLPALLPGLNSLSVELKKLGLRRFHDVAPSVILQALATPAARSLEVLEMNVSSADIAAEVKRVCVTRRIRVERGNGAVVAL